MDAVAIVIVRHHAENHHQNDPIANLPIQNSIRNHRQPILIKITISISIPIPIQLTHKLHSIRNKFICNQRSPIKEM